MKPLAGCRVLDLGMITAGAATSALLADFGAEVIKIEAANRPDPFRKWPASQEPRAGVTAPPFFRATNRGKLGLGLDLKAPGARDAFLRLARKSDVVVENFRRGVLGRLGLDYAALRDANPDIILASISSQGDTGPEAAYVSYGSTLEAVGGLAATTGYRGGDPVVSGSELNYPDQVVAIFAAAMVVTAWYARRHGAGGAHLDLSQRELTSFLCGEAFAAASKGVDPIRMGNAQAPFALQQCVAAQDGEWIAATVRADQLAALDAIAPGPERARALAAWAAGRSSGECLAFFAANTIAAAVARGGAATLAAMGRDWGHAMARLPDGALAKGIPVTLDSAPHEIACDAPVLGADTADILARIGGYTPEEIAALDGAGAIKIVAA